MIAAPWLAFSVSPVSSRFVGLTCCVVCWLCGVKTRLQDRLATSRAMKYSILEIQLAGLSSEHL